MNLRAFHDSFNEKELVFLPQPQALTLHFYHGDAHDNVIEISLSYIFLMVQSEFRVPEDAFLGYFHEQVILSDTDIRYLLPKNQSMTS